MPLVIRRATSADAATIADLGRRTFVDTFEAFNTPEDMRMYLDSAYTEELQRREIEKEEWISLLAEDDGKPAAFAQIRREDAATLEVCRFYVDKPWHGRGVAQALMTEVERIAAELRTETIWLAVWEHNPRAIAFYTKCGFRDTGSKPFILGTDIQTDRVMTRSLLLDRAIILKKRE